MWRLLWVWKAGFLVTGGRNGVSLETSPERWMAGGPTKSYLSVNKPGPESSFGEMYIEQISAYPGDEFEGGPDVL